jgi:hypothetical protein
MVSVHNLCDTVAWMEHGKLKMIGPARSVVDEYQGNVQVDRRDDEAGDGNRWGSGEGRIEEVEVLDASGRPTTRVRMGEAVTIRYHYKMDEPIPKPVFGLAIHTLDGTHVTGPNTRDAECVPDQLVGEGHVDFHVGQLMLVPGTYDLTVSLYDYACLHPFDFRHKVMRFDVQPGVPRENYGVVSLGGQWKVPDSIPRA